MPFFRVANSMAKELLGGNGRHCSRMEKIDLLATGPGEPLAIEGGWHPYRASEDLAEI
jgi:hypothetical protein